MPYINLKIAKQQITPVKKEKFVAGIMDIVVNIMGRDPKLTVITIDEINESNWFIAGEPIGNTHAQTVSYVEIKISKGTSSNEQMSEVITAGKQLMIDVFNDSEPTNYFVISEQNPNGWGFDGLSMTDRSKL